MKAQLAITLLAVLFLCPYFSQGDPDNSVTGTIRSADPQKRQVTVAHRTGGTERSSELDVSRKVTILLDGKPATLDALKPGQTVTLTYNAELAVVTRLEASSSEPTKSRQREDRTVITIVASGTGKDEKEATKQALMNAVQQAVGVVVDAETMVKNDEIITDQVLTYADAIVKSYEPVGKPRFASGLVTVKIKASVERRSLIERLGKANITVRDIDGRGLAAEAVTGLKAQKDAVALLNKELKDFPGDLIVGKVAGKPRLVSKDEETAKVAIPVTFSIDEAKYKEFAARLNRLLAGIALEKGTFLTKASRFPTDKLTRSPSPMWTIMTSHYSPFSMLTKIPSFYLAHDEHKRIEAFFKDSVYVFVADVSADEGRTIRWNHYKLDGGGREVLAAAYARVSAVTIDLIDEEGNELTTEQFPAVVRIKKLGLPEDLREPEDGKFAWLSPLTLDVASDRNWGHDLEALAALQRPGSNDALTVSAARHHVFYFWPQIQFTWDDRRNDNHFGERDGIVTEFHGTRTAPDSESE